LVSLFALRNAAGHTTSTLSDDRRDVADHETRRAP